MVALNPVDRLTFGRRFITDTSVCFLDSVNADMRLPYQSEDAVDGAGRPCKLAAIQPTGDIRRTVSTRKGNLGGESVQEAYRDSAGRAVTKHTVYDAKGRIIHGPHFRPGGFK